MDLPEYSFIDRLLHRLAFGGGVVQDMLCDVEWQLYGKEITVRQVTAPIFVTALPRAGTTLVLDILARHPDSFTHTYRDMPFVLSPLLWSKLTRRHRVTLAARERAHADGMIVDADSPEAFEEVLWLKAFASHYGERGIRPWGDVPASFAERLRNHIGRLAASRGGEATRYLSKNNANIARLPALRAIFPDARMLVPLRDPLDHAHSLRHQHLRFGDMHGQSAFAQRYMADIGHFEFGALHRPILFEGMGEVIAERDPAQLDYWLGYWIAAYRTIASEQGVEIVDMESLADEGAIGRLFDKAGLSADANATESARSQVKPMKHYPDDGTAAPKLLAEARELYASLLARA